VVGLWSAIPADCDDPDDLLLTQPRPHSLEFGVGLGKRIAYHGRKPIVGAAVRIARNVCDERSACGYRLTAMGRPT
jgi:hypothetical protein